MTKNAIEREPFGATPDGAVAELFSLRNSAGTEVRATNYGGIIVALRVADRNGRLDDIVLGYESLEGYLRESPYFGAIIGRYANRIREGRFTLDGQPYSLARNNGPNHLHGGVRGFDKVLWQAEPFERPGAVGIAFSYISAAGDEGYPGTVETRVTYTLTDRDELIFDYRASTDKATPLNLTQHSYFNLAGGEREILGHRLTVDADGFTPVDSTLIPTGEIRHVAGTPFDFRTEMAIGSRLDSDDEQMRFGRGYDHNFVLNKSGNELTRAATVYEPTSGRAMEVYTTEPGLQFYSGNLLDGTITGKGGRVYQRYQGFCLETQHFPDSPNQPHFPSTILRPGENYVSRSLYKFSARQ